jgi:tetratricopeptide (TPR) repeat protein
MRGDAMTAADSFRHVLRIESVSAGAKPTEAVALQHFNLGVSLLNARHYAEAETELRRAAAIYAPLLDQRHFHSRNVQSTLAVVLVRTGRVAESAAILEALIAQPIDHPIQEAIAKTRLGVVRRAQGQYDLAAALLTESADFFAARSLRLQQATALSDLGSTLLAQKRNGDALTVLMQARALLEKLHPDGSADRAETLTATARALLAAGRNDEALQACDAALRDWDASRAEGSGAVATRLVRAHALANLGKPAQARSEIERAAAMTQRPGLPEERQLLAEARRAIARGSP